MDDAEADTIKEFRLMKKTLIVYLNGPKLLLYINELKVKKPHMNHRAAQKALKYPNKVRESIIICLECDIYHRIVLLGRYKTR